MIHLRRVITAAFTRRYPFYSGCGSFANSGFVKFFSGTEGGKEWCRIPGGEVLADLSDYVGRASYFVGDLDRKITWICKKLTREGDTVLDIGTNIGMVTVLLSKLVGKKGKVYSFEPNPLLCEVIQQAIIRNNISNTHLYPVALGTKKESIELTVPRSNAGAGSLVRNKSNKDCDVFEVKVVTLDSICKEEGIKSIRLVKIDVEGFEAEVFSGARELLTDHKPDAILFELNERTAERFSEEPLIKLLSEFGYEFLTIPKSIFFMKLHPVNLNENHISGNDFLAAPRGQVFDEVSRLVNAS